MNKVLIVIDMQNDFIDGNLGTKEAQAIVPAVKEKLKNIKNMEITLFLQEIPTKPTIWILQRARNCQ